MSTGYTNSHSEATRATEVRPNGALLRKLRGKVSRRIVSESVGVAGHTIRRWEEGDRFEDINGFVRLARYYGYPKMEFVSLLVDVPVQP